MDIIISSILNILHVLCSCSANNKCSYLFDLQENKEDLSSALVELRATRDGVKIRVDDAEINSNQKCTPEVDSWLKRVQTIDDEVVQVIQKTDQEIQGRCFGGNCPVNCWSARRISKLVLRKLQIVNGLKSKGDSFGEVAYKLPPPSVQEEPTNTTVGMESMFDKVWRLLSEDEVRIIGLYGFGGVGKTTLLQQINNAFLQSTGSSNNNNVVIFVVVSKVINIDAIQNVIGSRLRLSSTDKTSIFNALKNKNYVLLLDDIWERVDLQSIGIPPPHENNKSKVIFTTRSETVCGHMDVDIKFRVECLPWDKAWTLFQEKVGNEALNSHPKVPELAKIVAKECGGLPLVLITIGRAMSSKKTVQEWNYAITTLERYASEFPGMGDEVLPLLKLSYDNLGDSMVKSCFIYCALCPEDGTIYIPLIIDYWIGEGLISLNEFDHIDDARNKGYYVIGILKGACLLESGKYEETDVKMHDTIRDLALWIAHDCGNKRDKMFIIKGASVVTAETETSSSWNNAERICMSIIHNRKMDATVTLPYPNLLTLIYNWTFRTLLVIPQNLFSFMPLLRVLDLSACPLETFPTSITDLLELRYLCLSDTRIEALPEDLGKLVKLKHLDLSFMMHLKEIPSGVIGGSLLELRVLNLFYSYRVDWDFDEVYELNHLNDLGININTQLNLNKLLSNQSLQMCTRRLRLFSSPSPSASASSSTTTTTTTTTTLGGVGNIKSLEKLELLSNLEKLYLESLPDVNMGVWENHYNYMPQGAPFQNLGQIYIDNCNALKDLTWIGYVVNLQRLLVYYCEELEEIVTVVVDDFGGSTRGGGGGDETSMMMNNAKDIFKRLNRLSISHLPKLKSICRNALAFPCLETMRVSHCPQLKKLPFDSGSNLNNTLQEISGYEEWWNELRWEEEEEDHDNNELLKSKFLPYFHKIMG